MDHNHSYKPLRGTYFRYFRYAGTGSSAPRQQRSPRRFAWSVLRNGNNGSTSPSCNGIHGKAGSRHPLSAPR